jgi:hypothetical protein
MAVLEEDDSKSNSNSTGTSTGNDSSMNYHVMAGSGPWTVMTKVGRMRKGRKEREKMRSGGVSVTNSRRLIWCAHALPSCCWTGRCCRLSPLQLQQEERRKEEEQTLPSSTMHLRRRSRQRRGENGAKGG